MAHIFVKTHVGPDFQPHVQLILDGAIAELTVAEAQTIAYDLLKMSARSESDAALFQSFTFPVAQQLCEHLKTIREQIDIERMNSTQT